MAKHLIISCATIATILFSCEGETFRLKNYEVHGIDVSHYQNVIDWDTVAAQDIAFAFVKATEGLNYADSFFCKNWGEMKRVGIIRGAYHFYRPTLSAKTQAENFLSNTDIEFGDLPPVLDVEVMDGVSKIELIKGIRDWLYFVELRHQVKPILYTNAKFYNRYLSGYFDEYPLWIARYHRREPRLVNDKPWDFWQYGNKGKLPGITGEVDFNVFKGTLPQLYSICIFPKPVLTSSDLPLN